MGRPVAFFEITSTDAERARSFYCDLFGWSAPTDPEDGYALVDTGAGEAAIGGGIGPAQGAGDAGVKIYVQVEDLEQSLRRATALGGTTLVAPTPLPGDYGRFAVFADPDGNPVGLWG
ncbi:VOC family protein [Actinoplanes aureus]|uniref:VOC family protein n=1 Tax=Actinoplanes aureus TaxID=2792083 RepID=A0A931FZ70_9ACTN|nr:VOC family protein [Actinoplanes aureus]MBG0564420.1 VOC family protein [Actinoplanes aureus]